MVDLGFRNLYNISMSNRTLIITKLAKYLILPILALFRAFRAYLWPPGVQLWGATCMGHVHKVQTLSGTKNNRPRGKKLGIHQ